MPTLPDVLTTADLPAAELQAARLDGEVFEVAGSYCVVDSIDDARVRAAAALGRRSPRLIAELGTASWIWGAAPAPPRTWEFCVDLDARTRRQLGTGVVVRELVLSDRDVVRLGRARATTPLRTAVDLARFRETFGEVEKQQTAALARLAGFCLDDALALLDRRRKQRGKRRAVERLRRVLDPTDAQEC